MSKSNTHGTKYCDNCKKVSVWRSGDFCAGCKKLTGKVNPIKQKYKKRTAAQQLRQNAWRKKISLAKREAGFLAARMVLPPTQEAMDQASATALEFFLTMKEEAIKSNPGKEIIISIAAVSEGGSRTIVQEMRKASLVGGGGVARLVKIVSKKGKNYWRNPTAQETSDIGKEGFMIYDGEYNHFLAEHVETFLHNHIKANLKKESIKLLQTISGNGGTKSSGPFKVGMRVFICDAFRAILLLGLFGSRSSLRTLPIWNRSISKNAVTRNW